MLSGGSPTAVESGWDTPGGTTCGTTFDAISDGILDVALDAETDRTLVAVSGNLLDTASFTRAIWDRVGWLVISGITPGVSSLPSIPVSACGGWGGENARSTKLVLASCMKVQELIDGFGRKLYLTIILARRSRAKLQPGVPTEHERFPPLAVKAETEIRVPYISLDYVIPNGYFHKVAKRIHAQFREDASVVLFNRSDAETQIGCHLLIDAILDEKTHYVQFPRR
jgi:hypothetical protein